ncbi:uncharacterized protein LODBEIA_P44080 [Lodderomyces beijingensis]|uniref:RRM domain-containing protein n=1 Tax=Lodderomyces beijingensis TaxID=1775926 RepID=A0ABP0ZPW7_9ASCO
MSDPEINDSSRKRSRLDDTNDESSARLRRSERPNDYNKYQTPYGASRQQHEFQSNNNGAHQEPSKDFKDRGRERVIGGRSPGFAREYQQNRYHDASRNTYPRGSTTYDNRRPTSSSYVPSYEPDRSSNVRSDRRPMNPPHWHPNNRAAHSRHTYDNNHGDHSQSYYPGRSSGRSSYGPSAPSHSAHTESQPKQLLSAKEIQDEIAKLTQHLTKLEDTKSIDDIKVIDSRWGVKPKGFEKVSAPRAKLSGLFPLPGFPRPIDFTKLEGLVKDRLSNSNDILNEVSKIDPEDSRAAKTLIVNNIEEINYLKIVEFFNDYLKMIDSEHGSTNNIHSKRKLKDDKTLIIEFNNSECATIIQSLNGTQLLFNAYKRDEVAARQEAGEKYRLSLSRPNEYVCQDEQVVSSDILETVKDSPRKISLLITPNTTSDQVMEKVEEIAPLQAMQYFRQRGTKEPLGLVFIEFKDQQKNILEKLENLSFVNNATYSCIDNRTYVQKGPVDFYSIPRLVRGDSVQPQRKSRVVQLINVLSIKDLLDDEVVKFATKDIKNEASKYGNVTSIRVPRPANDFAPGLQQFKTPGVGKVFIEYDDEGSALKAIMEMAGRSYNDRTVLATYFDSEDYKKSIF